MRDEMERKSKRYKKNTARRIILEGTEGQEDRKGKRLRA